MTCEVLEAARSLAKQKGLDPREVICPPDMKAICTTECPLITTRLSESSLEGYPQIPSGLEKFDNKLNGWAKKTGRTQSS